MDSNKLNPAMKKEISSPKEEKSDKGDNSNNENNTENEEDSVLDELEKMINVELTGEDTILKYKQIEDLFYSEMNFYEFMELMFFICRKYYLKINPNAVFAELQVPKKEKTKEKQKENMNIKQKEKETFMEIIN